MAALETSLTWLELTKLFQDGLYDIIQTRGKKKGSPGEVFLRQLLPDNVTESVIEQVNTLLAKMSKNGGNKWKDALDSGHITIVRGNSTYLRKISFKYWILPREALTSCIKEENKNLSIIKNNGQPDVHGQPDVQQTMEVMIEEPGNNNSGNDVNDDDNNDEAMEIVPPLVLSLAHSVNTMCKGIRVNAGHYLDSIFDQKLVLRSLAYCQDAWRTTSCNILVQNSSRCVSCSTYHKHRDRNDCKLHKKRLDMNQVIHEEICRVMRIQDKVELTKQMKELQTICICFHKQMNYTFVNVKDIHDCTINFCRGPNNDKLKTSSKCDVFGTNTHRMFVCTECQKQSKARKQSTGRACRLIARIAACKTMKMKVFYVI